jgi:hypothetical protein
MTDATFDAVAAAGVLIDALKRKSEQTQVRAYMSL